MTHPGTTILPHRYLGLASDLCNCDVAALSELSDASQIRTWTRGQMARYKKCISALLAIHNSIAPINMLPTEILQRVFAYVPFKSSWCTASWMVSLQSVCRRWRSVLLSTPEYWQRGLYVIANAPLSPRLAVDIDQDGDEVEVEDNDEDNVTYRNPRDLFLARSAPYPLELNVCGEHCVGWKVFEGHFARVTTFCIVVQDEDELYDFLDAMTTSMKRLETLELLVAHAQESKMSFEDFTLNQWQAEDLPRLGELRITNRLFSRATTVPSLHTVTLVESRDIESLPDLLDALEGCPALACLSLGFDSDLEEGWNGGRTLDRIVNLPNLRLLDVDGETSEIYLFSSCLSFPPTTRINAWVETYGAIGVFTLPSILPHRLSRLHMSPTIDRLYIHALDLRYYREPPRPDVSMIGSVEGVERLQVGPVFRLCEADDFLRFLEVFAACTVTELAVDIDGQLPSDVDGDFWKQFFAALPDVRRLELLSRTQATNGRETKRDIAEHFLASARILQQAGHETSLAWVLHALEGDIPYDYGEGSELGDIEQVLGDHAHQGGRLKSMELYITTSRPNYSHWWKVSGVTQITTDPVASRYMISDYVSGLAGAADTVTVAGG